MLKKIIGYLCKKKEMPLQKYPAMYAAEE